MGLKDVLLLEGLIELTCCNEGHGSPKEMFFQNQFPYMEVRRPFILGVQSQQWKATLSHWFMTLRW